MRSDKELITGYVGISNSDDRLSQAKWAAFNYRVEGIVRYSAVTVEGAWVTPSVSPFQEALWCVRIIRDDIEPMLVELRKAAFDYQQQSISWTLVNHINLITPWPPEGEEDDE